MAWQLKNEKDGSILYLAVNKDITIGRKDTDLIISNDQSISRKHATMKILHIESNLAKPDKPTLITLKDAASKYGTYVNEEQVMPEGKTLKKDDLITFGQCGSDFKLIYEPIIVTTSCVDATDKIILKNAVWTLGGHLVPEWRSDCTHLVMTEVKVTIKAACAMVSLKPMVTIQYFAELARRCNDPDRPVPNNYIPNLGETAITQDNVTFDIIPERKTLFENKVFIFLSTRQYKKLTLPLTISGASTIIAERKNLGKYEKAILKPNVSVIRCPSSELEQDMKGLADKFESILISNNRRSIPESDIGLAVVQCSTEHYCNPDYLLEDSALTASKIDSQTFTQNQVYAAQTEESAPICGSSLSSLSKRTLPRDPDPEEPIPSTMEEVPTLPLPEPIEEARSESTTKRIRQTSECKSDEPARKSARLSNDVVPSVSGITSSLVANSPPPVVKTEPRSPPPSPIIFDSADTQPLSEIKMETDIVPDTSPSTNVPVNVPCRKRFHEPRTSTQVSETTEDPNFLCAKATVNDIARVNENVDVEKNLVDLPSKVMVVKITSLVKPRPQQRLQQNSHATNNGVTRNFKKFKKSQHLGADHLPRIIGSQDLKLFNQLASKSPKKEGTKWMTEFDDEPKVDEPEDDSEPISRNTTANATKIEATLKPTKSTTNKRSNSTENGTAKRTKTTENGTVGNTTARTSGNTTENPTKRTSGHPTTKSDGNHSTDTPADKTTENPNDEHNTDWI